MSNIRPLRPPTGQWPPCPPPPGPCGPDFFSGLFWLQQNYEDVKRAQAFLRQMLTDIIKEDPTILSGGAPIPGITDGSEAQPGMVGEYLQFAISVDYPTGVSTQATTVGVLPPGDWDLWYVLYPNSLINTVDASVTPTPSGFANNMSVILISAATATATMVALSRALTSQPSLIALSVAIDDTSGSGGNLAGFFSARRRR